jgi:glutaredoxin 3
MPDVVMYTKTYCPYCTGAKALLQDKGVPFTEINVERDPARRAEMIQKSNGRITVPQIFVDGRGLGGFDDIAELDRQGKLDPILQIA